MTTVIIIICLEFIFTFFLFVIFLSTRKLLNLVNSIVPTSFQSVKEILEQDGETEFNAPAEAFGYVVNSNNFSEAVANTSLSKNSQQQAEQHYIYLKTNENIIIKVNTKNCIFDVKSPELYLSKIKDSSTSAVKTYRSIQAGTQISVFGKVFLEDGDFVFKDTKSPLLITAKSKEKFIKEFSRKKKFSLIVSILMFIFSIFLTYIAIGVAHHNIIKF